MGWMLYMGLDPGKSWIWVSRAGWTPLSHLSVRVHCPRIVANRSQVHPHCDALCRALPPDLTLTFVRTVRHLLSAPLPVQNILLYQLWRNPALSIDTRGWIDADNGGGGATTDATCWKITSKGPHRITSHCMIPDRNLMASPCILYVHIYTLCDNIFWNMSCPNM